MLVSHGATDLDDCWKGLATPMHVDCCSTSSVRAYQQNTSVTTQQSHSSHSTTTGHPLRGALSSGVAASSCPMTCPKLKACLEHVCKEPELVADILSACALTMTNAAQVASWAPDHASERLFLTPDEGAALVAACQSACCADSDVDEDAAPPCLPSAECDMPPRCKTECITSPSFMRSTASFASRSGKQTEGSERSRRTLSAGNSPIKPASLSSGRPNPMSRLMAPTASFLSRMARTQQETKAAREAAEQQSSVRQSQSLCQVLRSPQGQRVTHSHAFTFNTDLRAKGHTQPSTEEQQLEEAHRHAWKRHEVPAWVHEARPLDGFARTHSTPKDPAKVIKPFSLVSEAKHAQYQAMRASRLAIEAEAEVAMRYFKAQELDKAILECAAPEAKKSPTPVTQAVAPKLSSAQRAEYHSAVLDPARRARMSEVERQSLEERERKAAAQEAEERAMVAAKEAEHAEQALRDTMDVATLRKKLIFKARDLPKFSSPFKPDGAKAQPTTQASEFVFATTQRLGKPVLALDRDDAAEPALNKVTRLDGSDPFATSLRHSPGPTSPRAHAASPASPKRSPVQANLRSPAAKTNSVVSPQLKEAFQAALEAAASPRALSRRNTAEVMAHAVPTAVGSAMIGSH